MGVGEILHPFYYQQNYQQLFKYSMLQQNNIFYHVNYVKIKNYKKYGKTLSKLPLMKYSFDKN
jgi:hypothetical protein